MAPVTIAIDARTFHYEDSLARGIGHYSRHHLQAAVRMKPDWRFVCYGETQEAPQSLAPLVQRPNVSYRCADDFEPGKEDIVHICDPMGLQRGFDAPLRVYRGGRRYSVTFYDLIPLHLYFRQWGEALRRHYLSRLEQCVKSGATFLAISAYTGSDLIRQTRLAPERVKIIMAGLNSNAFERRTESVQAAEALKRYGIRKPFFLHVGALAPHKNFDTCAAAFMACRQTVDAQLVVVGQKAGELRHYAEYCAAKELSDFLFTGYIPREELDILYQEAAALLFMSRFEGFGFPVLEAMAAGCPVITSNVTSIPEVAGDAAILLDPADARGVCNAMLDLMARPDYAAELRRKGFRQASGFTWEQTAGKTIAVWEDMLSDQTAVRKASAPAAAYSPARPADQRKPLRVLLDISVLGLSVLYESSKTGVFRVVENLARGLAGSPEVEVTFCSTQHLTEKAPDTTRACRAYLEASPGLQQVPFCAGDLPEADIFHSPFHALPDAARRYRRFLTVCDLIPWLYPEMFAGKAANPIRHLFAGLNPDDRFLCISRSTREDLCRHARVEAERVHVAYLAADPDLFYPCRDAAAIRSVLSRYGVPEKVPYFLSLCTLEPRKNLAGALRAFGRLIASGRAPAAKFVLVGTQGWNAGEIFRVIRDDPALQQRVVITGFVADEDLAALYSGALAFLYMSHYEGFGLPPLEAMQCGTPVIVSDNSALPEVVGKAGIRLDSKDQDRLVLAMNEVAVNADLRTEMSQRSLRQASQFSWDRFIDQTIAAYRAA